MNSVLYLAAVFVTNAGNSCAFIILGKYSLDLFGLASVFGGILLLEQLKSLTLSYAGGRLAHRFGARQMVVGCDLALFFGGLACGLLALNGFDKAGILSAALLINLSKPFYSPALFAFVREITPSHDIRAINSRAAAAQQLGWIAGLAVAGFFIQKVAPGWMIIFDSLTYLLSAALLLMCRRLGEFTSEDKRTSYSWKTILHHESFIWMLVIAVQVNFIVAYNIALFRLVSERFPHQPSFLSWFEIVFAIPVAAIAAFRGRGLETQTVGLAFLLQAMVFLAIPLSSSIVVITFLVAAFGALGAFIFPLAFEKLYSASESTRLADVGAAKGMVQAVVAIPVLTAVSALLDLGSLGWAYSAVSVLSAALGVWLIRKFQAVSV